MPKSPESSESSPRGAKLKNTPKTFKKKFNLLNFLAQILNIFNLPKRKSILHESLQQLKYNSKKMTQEEKTIFGNFLKFGSKTVEDVMIPRSDIIAVKDDISLEELNHIVIKYSHTRILVYADTLDNIIGFIHIKDLFKILAKKQTFHLKKTLRKPIISAPSMKLIDLLAEMQKKRTHIAIVVDEYGGTDGIVTIEDVMEEIVGRIDDEHDEKLESDSFKIIDSTTILSSSRVEVENLEKILGVKLKEENDEFDTIGGLVLAKVGKVPLPGTKIEISDQVELEVIDANPRTLKRIKLKLKNHSIDLQKT